MPRRRLTADGAAEALVGRAIEAWGRLDILVNNAGYTLDAPVHKMSDADFCAMLDIPLGRAGTPEEAAGGIAFLCLPWSDYVTGQVLNVSGGIAMGMTA